MKRVVFIFLTQFISQLLFADETVISIPTGYPEPTQTQLPPSVPAMEYPKTEIKSEFRLGERDPFSPPKYIRDMEQVKPEDVIDKRMEAIRRWPLWDYKLRGIIWDVKNPKAMIVDKTNTLHLLKKNYRIGNREGLISEINESEVVVLQKGVPMVMRIERAEQAFQK